MTSTKCDVCWKKIDRLGQVDKPMKAESHGQAPDGYRVLLFRDLECAQGEWDWTDLCYSCCFRLKVGGDAKKIGNESQMLTLAELQRAVEKGWTSDGYSEQFKTSPSFYKDFDHALKHVRKATQALENITEEMDHGTEINPSRLVDARKYVADIVISAARLANEFPPAPSSPYGQISLEEIVVRRLEEKINLRQP